MTTTTVKEAGRSAKDIRKQAKAERSLVQDRVTLIETVELAIIDAKATIYSIRAQHGTKKSCNWSCELRRVTPAAPATDGEAFQLQLGVFTISHEDLKQLLLPQPGFVIEFIQEEPFLPSGATRIHVSVRLPADTE